MSASYSDGASAGAYVGLRTLGGDVQNGSLLVDGLTAAESNEVGGEQDTTEMCIGCTMLVAVLLRVFLRNWALR